LSNVTSLDFWGNQLTNVAGVSGMAQLNWLGLSRNNLTVVQSLSGLPNLGTIDLYTNHLTNISGVAGLSSLTWLNANDNDLQDIHSLTNLTSLIYAGLLYNLLDTNLASVAMANIGVMQSHGAYVDYIPQKTASSTTPVLVTPEWLGGNQFRFTIQGLPGTVLRIWTSTDLVTWTPGSFVTNLTGTVTFTDSAASGVRQFYRTQKL
jgi:Leucine-rich repeat (LRR) protein